MADESNIYGCAIIGGGLAGLALSIELARKGVRVLVFEKNQYPFHRVCGEYISMESWDYLTRLGIPLADMQLPRIRKLGVSSQTGFMLNHDLEPGGFGISRYTLDELLYQIAVKQGVDVKCGVSVRNVIKHGDSWTIDTSKGSFYSKMVCGSFGKYTPSFLHDSQNHPAKAGARNYIGVKYHIKTDLPEERIELHNFQDGYCGVSKVDQDRYCLCYLTASRNLIDNQKDIRIMEEKVLFENPFLKRYFTNSDFLFQQPVVVSNVEFRKKHTDVGGVFLLGDAAGSITPLCGNGMSMALRGGHILSKCISGHITGNKSLSEVAENYRIEWDKAFNNRITAGYYLQFLFGKKNATDLALRFLALTPGLTKRVVGLTHGEKF